MSGPTNDATADSNDAIADSRATIYEVVDRTAIITLNRPHRGNAWTGRMHAEYRRHLRRADSDDAVRAVIVTGAGDKFCVGGDVAALEKHAASGAYDDGLTAEVDPPLSTATAAVHREFEPEFAYHFGLSKPVVAALNGAAAGIGLALACFADLRFAAPGAKLTTAHGKLALPPEYGLSWLLPRQVGLPRALDVLLSSRVFTTDEAHAWGLVTELVDAERLLDHALAFAGELTRTVSAESLRATRHMVYLDLHRGIGESVAESRDRLNAMVGTADYRKGVDALSKRRHPEF